MALSRSGSHSRKRLSSASISSNSLGPVKFIFPNTYNVYVHGTPATELFSRSRRDFSHGCIRVGNPLALAEWVLHNNPEWTEDRIVAAINGSETIHVDLLIRFQF